MAVRRELLSVAILAATLLFVLPAAAMAAPQWLPGETRDVGGASLPPDVTAVGDRYAAIWVSADAHVYAAERPRGGPWGPREDVDPGQQVDFQAPKIAALPDGALVALWVRSGAVQAARRPPGGPWSAPQAISSSCCVVLEDLVAGADGSAFGLWGSTDDSAQTAVLPPGETSFEAAQDVPGDTFGREIELAVAPDGSALVAQSCSDSQSCLEAVFRPENGAWGTPEPLSGTSRHLTAIALVAKPESAFTLVWSEDQDLSRSQNPPGELFSRDRGPGLGGAWQTPLTVMTSLVTAAGCPSSFGCVDLAVAGDGTQAAVWQQGPASSAIAASVRPPGGTWGPVETVDPLAGVFDARPRTAFSADGTLLAAWVAESGRLVRAAQRTGNDAWSAQTIGGSAGRGGGGFAILDDLVADGDGDAATAWIEGASVEIAGYDAAGPRFSAFSLPSGSAGQTLAFSAAADDNWSGPPSISWLFGDDTGGAGSPVSHAYGAAGTYTATATATDGVGNAAGQSGSVGVAAAPTPTPTVTPDPCGTADTDRDGIKNACDDNNGAARPVPFKTVNATVVSGEVFVKLPAGSASASQARPPKGFVRLEGAETIPVRSTLDTARGRVKIRSAANTRRKTQTGQFFRGRFVIRQVRRKRRSSSLVTDLRLSGSSFRRTCRTTASVSQRRRRSKKRVRRLFGDARGSFRTSGRNAAATVRGTRWGVQDRCDGTLVAVQRGRVEVRDKVKRKTIILRAGRTYVARSRR